MRPVWGAESAASRGHRECREIWVYIGGADVLPVPIPLDCVDGFGAAYYGRPERLLDPGARRANSRWSFVDDATATGDVEALRADPTSGAGDATNGHLRSQPTFDGSLRLVVARRRGDDVGS